MKRKILSLLFALALLTGLTIPAQAVETPTALSFSTYLTNACLFSGTIQEVIRDEDGALKQLRMEAFGVDAIQTVAPDGGGACMVNVYYDTIYVDDASGTPFDPDDLKKGETVTIASTGEFYGTKPVGTVALAVLRHPVTDGPTARYYAIGSTAPEKDAWDALPLPPDTPVSTYTGAPAALTDLHERDLVLVWADFLSDTPIRDCPIQRLMLLDIPGTKTLTRGQFASMLHLTQKSPVVNYLMRYSDVSERDANAEAIRWASSEGLMRGYPDGTFRPDAPMDRQQVVTVLFRAKRISDVRYSTPFQCKDKDQIAPYAMEAMEWAYHDTWLTVDGNGLIRPCGRVTVSKAERMLNNAGFYYRPWLPDLYPQAQVVTMQ